MSLYVVSRPQIGYQLLDLCQSAKKRLWIVSPYIGAWKIRRVLGTNWWTARDLDVRLLTDKDERPLNRDTALRFAQKGTIKTLRGVHAKLYIGDDSVLLTSANLTVTAFTRRYEAGILLKGLAAKDAIALFETWWKDPRAEPFTLSDVLNLPRKKLDSAGEGSGVNLPDPTALPPDQGDYGGQKFVDLFGDYSDFLKCYGRFVKVYRRLDRVWPDVPLYLETDALLDFLLPYGDRLSQAYTRQSPRELTEQKQQAEINMYALKFQAWARERHKDGLWRKNNSREIRRLLSPTRIEVLSRSDIRGVAQRLNCMGDPRVRNRFLQPSNNPIRNIRNAWQTLLHGHNSELPTNEMSACASALFGFKRSSVQELLGWYLPMRFPIRNLNVNAGLRFLGFNIRAS